MMAAPSALTTTVATAVQLPTPLDVAAGVLPTADAALRCAARQLVQQQRGSNRTFTIACFGTSVTAGTLKKRTRYPNVLSELLSRKFPHANIKVESYGYSGATAQYLHACIDRLLPTADMYIVELADNFVLGHSAYFASLAALSDIVRDLRERTSADGRRGGAVAMLAPFAQSCAKQLLRKKPYASLPRDASTTRRIIDACFDANSSLPAIMETFAATHTVGGVSVRRALARALRAQHATTSSTTTDATASFDAFFKRFLISDMVHPNAKGYAEIAQLVAAMITRAAAESTPADCTAAGGKGAGGRGGLGGSSPSLGGGSVPAAGGGGSRVCAFGESLHPHVLSTSRGWAYTVEHSAAGHPKPGYIATRPGAVLDTCFHPPSSSSRAAREEVWWQLGYLRSYEGMGMAMGECHSGCSCTPRVFNAHTPNARVSQTAVSKLLVRVGGAGGVARSTAKEGCPCAIRLTVLNRTESAGYKMKLVALFQGFRMYNPSFALCALNAQGRGQVPQGTNAAHFQCPNADHGES